MARSVIDIELNDSAWKAFNRSVIRHQIELKKMPGQWGAVGSSIGKAGNAASKFVASIVETNRQFKNANTAAGKMTLALKASDRVVSSLGRGTATVARNLKDATKSLLGWLPIMGIFSGLVGAGGLFGIARLASSVSAGQTSSTQAGTTYGGEKAAQTAYGQMLGGEGGVTGLLRTMAKEQQTGGLMFRKLGLSEGQWQGKSTSDILSELLKALKKMQETSPEGVKALVAEKFLPEGIDYNTLLGISAQNLELREKEYKSYKRQLELSRPMQDSWSNFQRQLQFAGEKIEGTFVRGLTPLLPALTKFSESLVSAINTIMTNPATKRFIEGLGSSLNTFAKYLGSEKFTKDFDGFADSVRKVSAALVSVAEFVNKWLGKSDENKAFENDVLRMKQQSGGFAQDWGNKNPKALIEQIPGQSNVRVDVFVNQDPSSNFTVQAAATAGRGR